MVLANFSPLSMMNWLARSEHAVQMACSNNAARESQAVPAGLGAEPGQEQSIEIDPASRFAVTTIGLNKSDLRMVRCAPKHACGRNPGLVPPAAVQTFLLGPPPASPGP